MSGDNNWTQGWTDGWVGLRGGVGWGGVKRRVVCPLSLLLLLLLLRGLTLSAGCQKGRRRICRRADLDNKEEYVTGGLPVIGSLSVHAEVQLPSIHLFCPLQCPDAAPLPLSLFLSEGG